MNVSLSRTHLNHIDCKHVLSLRSESHKESTAKVTAPQSPECWWAEMKRYR